MKVSVTGKNLIKEFEGLSLKPYRDATGYSIGYGHFIKESESYLMNGITLEQAELLFNTDIETVQNLLNSRITYPLNQNQFDALASLAFNVPYAVTQGSIDDKINAGKFSDALLTWEQYTKYKDSNGVLRESETLKKRRKKEIELFLKPIITNDKGGVFNFFFLKKLLRLSFCF